MLLDVDLSRAAGTDDLAHTVSYAEVAADVVALVEGASLDLIETLAARIADTVLARPLVEAVEVTVHKPQAPVGVPFGDVAVTVRRERCAPVVVALGANLGDVVGTLASAVRHLAEPARGHGRATSRRWSRPTRSAARTSRSTSTRCCWPGPGWRRGRCCARCTTSRRRTGGSARPAGGRGPWTWTSSSTACPAPRASDAAPTPTCCCRTPARPTGRSSSSRGAWCDPEAVLRVGDDVVAVADRLEQLDRDGRAPRTRLETDVVRDGRGVPVRLVLVVALLTTAVAWIGLQPVVRLRPRPARRLVGWGGADRLHGGRRLLRRAADPPVPAR